jgi:hypothetical protein
LHWGCFPHPSPLPFPCWPVFLRTAPQPTWRRPVACVGRLGVTGRGDRRHRRHDAASEHDTPRRRRRTIAALALIICGARSNSKRITMTSTKRSCSDGRCTRRRRAPRPKRDAAGGAGHRGGGEGSRAMHHRHRVYARSIAQYASNPLHFDARRVIIIVSSSFVVAWKK